jgi:negative regulator of sigma-B (phosphoserine phosphatase)
VDEEPLRLIDWAVATRAIPGELESGDLHLVSPFEGGALVAAIDGLGHGPEAAAAAKQAAAALESSAGEPVTALLERCHRALRGTRGAVITLARFDQRTGTVSWVGVGNIEGTLVRTDPGGSRARETVMLAGGVAGHQLPSVRASEVELEQGDTLVFATDGVRRGYVDAVAADDPPRRVADRILEEFGKGTDDALVLVVRYVGGAP